MGAFLTIKKRTPQGMNPAGLWFSKKKVNGVAFPTTTILDDAKEQVCFVFVNRKSYQTIIFLSPLCHHGWFYSNGRMLFIDLIWFDLIVWLIASWRKSCCSSRKWNKRGKRPKTVVLGSIDDPDLLGAKERERYEPLSYHIP